MDERAPLGNGSAMPVQAPVISSCPTIDNQSVISLSLPGGVNVFTYFELVVVKLPKFQNQYELAQIDSTNSTVLVTLKPMKAPR